ncbi:hypothetical protein GCM10011529_02990 [Polymorphobacter glacialis]|uniref:DUF4239 domain-containing protein n=1 Tax=Sandarakinorhabdus glacialis TaxID=1614636 RepID=A0A916ZJF2_9SPHN|nr:hypothetical protein [Polymorphobacter glacialis]GGE00206.1 hypothetical protein GCM10011529_02990 [Polymorphobacter glacialis]
MQLLFTHPLVLCIALFAAFLLSLELGRWLARRAIASGHAEASGSAVDAAVFAVLGLLIAFTFSAAAARFDHRRDLIVEEANAIGTAWLRIDLVPADARPPLRNAFRRYAASRVDAYAHVGNEADFRAALGRSTATQGEIWQLAITAGARPDALPAANMLLLPALNDMIDITATRALSMLMHTPATIAIMLLTLAMVAAALAGFGMGAARNRDWLRLLSFAAIMTVTLYVIADLEFPRFGIINVAEFENAAIALTHLQ